MNKVKKNKNLLKDMLIESNKIKKTIYVKAGNSLETFFLNKLLPFYGFLSNFPQSLIKALNDLDELHEIELYDRLFLIRQAEKKITKASNKHSNPFLDLKNRYLIIKNKIQVNLNKRILNIFFKTTYPKKMEQK
tara:strand:+ start:1884 stop:2285 length:402 start_codon:yes stop_codon:yes gene_type:complete